MNRVFPECCISENDLFDLHDHIVDHKSITKNKYFLNLILLNNINEDDVNALNVTYNKGFYTRVHTKVMLLHELRYS